MSSEEEQMRMELQRMQRRADEVTNEVLFYAYHMCVCVFICRYICLPA